MAFTEAQWAKLQSAVPRDERMSYAQYLASLSAAERRSLLESAITTLTTADEQAKIAGGKADTAAQKAAVAAAAQVISNFKQAEVDSVTPVTKSVSSSDVKLSTQVTPSTTLKISETKLDVNDPGYDTTRIGDTGKTSAQLDAEANAVATAALIGANVDTATGLVVPGGPGKQPGAAWILSPDGKSWIKPPQPNPTDTWDDTKGWVPKGGTKDPGKQPGAAWILNADKSAWIKPPQPNATDTWDDEKGWIPAKGGGSDYTTVNGVLMYKGAPFTGTYNGKEYVNGKLKTGGGDNATPERPVGTPPAFIWDPVSKTWKMPPKPTTKGNWLFDPNEGWVDTTVVPGSSGFTATEERTLAINTFKNTLGLFFGAAEMDKPWVSGLYKYVSGFYKTGSSLPESLNLALLEGRFDPNLAEFTKRFKGIYALTDLKAKGAVVTVPTIAEYFATESTMGEVLKTAGLGKLANEDFLGDIIGKNVSVTEFTNRITKVYDRIDSAPAELKSTFARFFPSIDRVTLATALLTGEKGAAELAKEVASYEIVSASEQQGLGAIDPVTGKRIGIGLGEAQNIAAQGYGYQAALTGFGQISQNLQPYEKLMEISSGQDVSTDDARKQLQDITFGKLASAQRKADQLAAEEEARFRSASGLARGGLTSQKYGLV